MRLPRSIHVFSLICCFCAIGLTSFGDEHYDLLIKNVKIVDGTGKAAFTGNIAIKGDKIAALGSITATASTVLDGTGLTASPGFIDPHSHSDSTILKYPLAENYVMQGVTTVTSGHCGYSTAPTEEMSFSGWQTKVEETGISINIAPLVGHGAVRGLVMGHDWRRKANKVEIEAMKTHVEEAMKSGAFGLSSGLDYAPTQFADKEELVELARIAGRYGGFYDPHTRGIHSQWPTQDPEEVSYGLFYGKPEDAFIGTYNGYVEAIEIAREADVPLHIAHMSNCFLIPQPHTNSEALEYEAGKATVREIVEKAREEGLEVTFDFMAYSRTIAGAQKMIDAFYSERIIALSWVREIEKEEFISRLKTREFRERIKRVNEKGKLKLGMIHLRACPYWMDFFKILTCTNRELEGQTIGEIARMKNIDALDAIFEVLIEDPETIWVQFGDPRVHPESLKAILESPLCMPSTDTPAAPAEPEDDMDVNPIMYGLYPHYINTYVKEENLFSLEEAIRKATSYPAEVIGLKNRGILKQGAFADILVFNFETIKDVNDFLNPTKPPEGIEYVIVNGKIVYKDMTHTGEKSGRILRRE